MYPAEYEKKVAKIALITSVRRFVRKVIDGNPARLGEFDASLVAYRLSNFTII